jgi:glyoxylase-like metal-dependent hydrolase (beta-lactamase superfamily II)
MLELEKNVRRVTFSLPFGIDHVHCYFLRSSGGGWILVDTGLGSLARIEELAPRIAYAGHRDPIADPAGRAREIEAHHAERLDRAAAALDGAPLSAYDVSLALFETELSSTLRRFATAESLAHLERLVLEGRARRSGDGYVRAAPIP